MPQNKKKGIKKTDKPADKTGDKSQVDEPTKEGPVYSREITCPVCGLTMRVNRAFW